MSSTTRGHGDTAIHGTGIAGDRHGVGAGGGTHGTGIHTTHGHGAIPDGVRLGAIQAGADAGIRVTILHGEALMPGVLVLQVHHALTVPQAARWQLTVPATTHLAQPRPARCHAPETWVGDVRMATNTQATDPAKVPVPALHMHQVTTAVQTRAIQTAL